MDVLDLVLHNGYVQAILGYAVLLILIGWFVGRRVRSSSGFFVAGRRLGTGLLFTTLIAANIGAGSTVGVAAIAYKSGVSADSVMKMISVKSSPEPNRTKTDTFRKQNNLF